MNAYLTRFIVIFKSWGRSTSQLQLCLGSNLYNSQITARDVKVKNIKEADEQKCSDSDSSNI